MSTVVLPGLAGRHDAASRAGRGLDILLSSEDTAGTAAVVDCHVPAATAGPPLHLHPASDETFVVISGTLLVHVDGQVTELTAGAAAERAAGGPVPPPELIKLAAGFDWQLAGPPLLPTGDLLRIPA
jgi:hypothetical protein